MVKKGQKSSKSENIRQVFMIIVKLFYIFIGKIIPVTDIGLCLRRSPNNLYDSAVIIHELSIRLMVDSVS